MNQLIPAVGTVALLGSALVGGIFFAFSSFLMKALARVPLCDSPARPICRPQAKGASLMATETVAIAR